jgi:hypothetical protein
MKPKLLLLCALLAFFAGIGLLASGWNGNSSITAAWPISASVVKLSGSATGWRAMAGIAALLLAPILLVWSLINLATGSLRSSQRESLPESAPEVKREAAPQ